MPFSDKKIITLERVDSTNNYAMAMIRKGAAIDGNAVFTLEQTHGKGRPGKTWKSNKAENIILSIILQMQWLPLLHQFELSAAVAVACLDFMKKYTATEISVKWPNDIFINDRKAGGILIENVVKGAFWQWAVIGVGMNINQMEFDSYNLMPGSLKQVTGKNYDVLQMAKVLHTSVLKRVEEIKAGNFPKILGEYNQNLFARNQLVKLKKENIIFETTIKEVSSSGELITQDAYERHFNFDEVEFKGLI